MSFAVYLTFFLPRRISRPLVNHFVNRRLIGDKMLASEADEMDEEVSTKCKLGKIRALLGNKLFIQFINDGGYLTSFDQQLNQSALDTAPIRRTDNGNKSGSIGVKSC